MYEQESKEKLEKRYSKQVKKIYFRPFKDEIGSQVEEDLPKTSMEQVVIFPILTLNKTEVNSENIGFNTKIPEIRIKPRDVIVPFVEIFQKTSLIEQIGDFDLNLPDNSPRKTIFTIPIINLPSFKKTDFLLLHFEKEIPDIRVKSREKLIPIYSKYNRENLRYNYRFNVKIDSIFLKYIPIQIQGEMKEIKKVKNILEKIDPSEDLKPPFVNPDEELVEDDIPQEILGLSSIQFSKKPVVIFLKDPDSSYTPIIELFCQRIYREIKGGFAEPKKITNHEDFKEIINFWLKAENMIFTIDYRETSEHVQTDKDNQSLNEEFLRNNLEQLYNQGLGFIIFKNIKFDPEKFYPQEHLDIDYRIIVPNERLENNFKMNLQLCSFLWGLVKTNIDTFYISPENKKKFNVIFYETKKMYDKILTEIRQPYDRATKRHEGISKESYDVHYKLKRFVVKYISNELGFSKKKDIGSIKKYIHTEFKYYYNNNFTRFNYTDILVDDNAEQFKNEAFEIETLFSEGIKKIDETIDKYENYPINKLNIVLDNITFLNHVHELKDLKIMNKYENRGFELEFWTLNLSNNKLINYNEVVKRLKELEKVGLLPIFHQTRY